MDVTDATFETDVLERSRDVTVVVDLWASWCGPCKVLGPILEKVVGEASGIELVKVDVDANPRSAATFQVQSIPAVYAIRDRKVVDSFIGALPEAAVRQWVESLAPVVTEVDRLVAAGDEGSLRKALELEPGNEKAVLALAAFLVAGGSPPGREEALGLLARIPETPETRHLAAQARLGDEAAVASGDGAGAGSGAGVASGSGSGSTSESGSGSGSGSASVEAKLDALLERVRGDEAARQEFVDLLELLGPDDPRTATYRKALTARLF